MLIHEKIKTPLLAGALTLALLPMNAGAAGVGGHMGGGASFHAMTPPPTAPNVPATGPGQRAQSGATASAVISPHARITPVTGTRLPTPRASGEASAGAKIPSHAPLHPFATPDDGVQHDTVIPPRAATLDPPPPQHGEEQ